MKFKILILLILAAMCSMLMAVDPWGEPVVLSGSMTVMAQVSINGAPAVNGDVLAAFVTVSGTEQLRGKAAVQVISGVAGCLLQVFTESNGETITFKVWDESVATVCNVQQTLATVVNGTIGSYPDNLYQINAGTTVQQVATPSFSPAPGNYPTAQNVSITCATTGAEIRYTTNGTEPTTTSTLYTGVINMPMNSTTTLKARAFLAEWTPSEIATGVYTITSTVATPVFNPPGGTYTSAQNVAITCATPGATIRYTTNGAEPTTASPVYSTPLAISATTTVKSRAWLTGWTTSPVATAQYVIAGQVTDPWPEPQVLSGSMTVMAQVSINGAPAVNGDILAAFVTVGGIEQLRGKAAVQVISGVAGCLLQVFTESNGEAISFKVWDYSAQQIFTVSTTLPSEVNGSVGSYPDNLYQINAGTTMVTDPWPEPQVLSGSMTVMAQVSINGAPAVNGDIVAAFVTVGGTEQLRGKAAVQVISGVAGCLLQVFTESNGEAISFKVWDYSAQQIFTASTTLPSEVNGSVGSYPDNLYQINAGTAPQQVETPVFNPPAGTYSSPQNVAITCTTPGATIRYTTNGAEPTTSSPVYSTPLAISATTTVKSRAWLTGWTTSPVATAQYVIAGQVTDPWPEPQVLSGSMTVMAQVSINGAPGVNGDIVAAFVTVGGTEQLRGKAAVQVISGVAGCLLQVFTESNGEAISFKVWDYSAQQIFTASTTLPSEVNGSVGSYPDNLYQINAGAPPQQVQSPTFAPPAGTYTSAQNVTITCATPGAQIRYTTNGAEPTATSTLYSAPVAIAVTTTLKAKAFLTNWDPSLTVTGVYTITGTVAAPVFAPPAGTYTSAQNVSITCATPGAQIRYTTNGSEPTTTSTLYSAPVAIAVTTTLKAKAFLTNWDPSSTATGVYTITGTVAAPVFAPPAGTYTSSQNVIITCATAGATIRYTLDSTEPSETSAVYTTPIQISTTLTLKARGFMTGWAPSNISEAQYVITGTVAMPVYDPPPGYYPTAQNVTITCATPGAQIRYTTNGAEPTATSTLYTTPVLISTTTTLKARAFLTGWTPSAVNEGTYIITGTVATPTFNPPAGTYTTAQSITIGCSTPGAQIRYTTDGTEPTEASSPYSNPLEILATTTLKAKAYLVDWLPSEVATTIYTITGTVAAPVFDPEAGAYTMPLNVSISCSTPGAQICYTVDGTDPTPASTAYTAPVFIEVNTTIKARAYLTDWEPSPIAIAYYQVSVSTPEEPQIPIVTGIQTVYPNPFSRNLTIKLGIKDSAQDYQIKVYNLKGECVYLTQGYAKGIFELTWNGHGTEGVRLASGVYLLSFTTGNVRNTRKILLR